MGGTMQQKSVQRIGAIGRSVSIKNQGQDDAKTELNGTERNKGCDDKWWWKIIINCAAGPVTDRRLEVGWFGGWECVQETRKVR